MGVLRLLLERIDNRQKQAKSIKKGAIKALLTTQRSAYPEVDTPTTLIRFHRTDLETTLHAVNPHITSFDPHAPATDGHYRRLQHFSEHKYLTHQPRHYFTSTLSSKAIKNQPQVGPPLLDSLPEIWLLLLVGFLRQFPRF